MDVPWKMSCHLKTPQKALNIRWSVRLLSWTECRLVRLVFLIACHLDDDEWMSTALVNLTNQTQMFKCLLRFSINTVNTFQRQWGVHGLQDLTCASTGKG